MNPATSSAIAALAGKASLVLGVLGLGVGTAAAAGADVPLLTPTVPAMETTATATENALAPAADDGSGRTVVDAADTPDVDAADTAVHGAAVSELARTTELEGCAKGQAVAEMASRGTHVARDCDEPEESSATAEEPTAVEPVAEPPVEPPVETTAEANHGQVVSEFARTTELEGCAKGQAVAELASGGNHVAKECDDAAAVDEPPTAAPTAADAPGRSGDAPGRSGDAPGRSGDAPKGGKHGTGRNG